MIHLTPHQSRAAALTMLALVLALGVLAVATPLWLLNRRYDIAIEDAVTRVQRYSKIAGMQGGLQQKFAEVNALGSTRHFLRNASPALAAVELQELVNSVLDTNGGKLNSMQILPHKDEGLYRQISITLQLTAPLSAMKAMIYRIESARPYLFINNFSVRSYAGFAPRPTATTEPELTIQFDLTGYALKGTP